MIKLFFLLSILYAMPAHSITCVKDYGGENTCLNAQGSSGDCAALGYSTAEVEGCTQYLTCPFNSKYKICIAGAKNLAIDCATIGFTVDDKSNWCAPEKIIKCPANESLTLCDGIHPEVFNCVDFGFTTDDKTAWCGDLIYCPVDNKYTLCGGLDASECAIGDVFYADGTCSSVKKFDKNKIPVGVVYSLSATEDGIPYDTATAEKTKSKYGRVINLRDLTSDGSTYAFNPIIPYSNNLKTVYFGGGKQTSGLTSYGSNTLLTAFQNNNAEIFDGKEYTAKLASAISTDNYCKLLYGASASYFYNLHCFAIAPSAALSFYPPEVSKHNALVGAGKWYLPALGELALLHGIDVNKMTNGSNSTGATGTTQKIVNSTLEALISKGVDAETLSNDFYWSSLDAASTNSWIFRLSDGYRITTDRYSNRHLRVSTLFNLENATPDIEKVECNYYDQNSCTTANENLPCTKDDNGCYIASGCAIGDVYYSDGSCGNVDNYDFSKVAVGVVYALSAEKGGIPYTKLSSTPLRAKHGRVINLRYLYANPTTYTFDPEKPYDDYNTETPHGTTTDGIYFGLYQTAVNGVTVGDILTAFKNDDIAIYNGKTNTQKFAAAKSTYYKCTNGTYTEGTRDYSNYCVPTAAKAALSFYPPEVSKSDPIVGAGNWYIPAIGEFALLVGIDIDQVTSEQGESGATGTTKDILNDTLKKLKTKGVNASVFHGKALTGLTHFTSTRNSNNCVWLITMSGSRIGYNCGGEDSVRLSLEF